MMIKTVNKKVTKLFLGVGIFLSLSSFGFISCSTIPVTLITKDIKLFSTNDIHGRIINNTFNKEVGIESIAGFLANKKYDLLLDGGDLIQGTPLNDIDKGKTIAKITEIMKYDGIAVGNHEFDFGLQNIIDITKNLNSSYLSSNIKYKSNQADVFLPHTIKTLKNGLKVGIIGLTTVDTKTLTHPNNVAKLEFEDIVIAASRQIDLLEKQGINFITVVSHVGASGKNGTENLVKSLPNKIDLIVDGHTHVEYSKKIGTTHIIQTGEYSQSLRESDFNFNSQTGLIENFETKVLGYDLIKNQSNFAPEVIKKLVSDLEITQNELFKNVVVENAPFILNGDRSAIRFKETNMGNFVTDAMLFDAKESGLQNVDFAITNSGGIRSSTPAGKVTYGDIYNVFPFTNQLRVVSIPGNLIRQAITYSVNKIGEGSMLQVSAELRITYQRSNQSLKIEVKNQTGVWEALNDSKTYLVATNDFILVGGDGYTSLNMNVHSSIQEIKSLGLLLLAIENYFKNVQKNNLWEQYKNQFPTNSRLIYS